MGFQPSFVDTCNWISSGSTDVNNNKKPVKETMMLTKLAHITYFYPELKELLWDVFFFFPYPHILSFILLDDMSLATKALMYLMNCSRYVHINLYHMKCLSVWDFILFKNNYSKCILQEEAPYYADVIGEVQQKIQDLQELNKGRQIPELTNSQKEIQEKFEKSSTMANQLETIMANFSDERENLQRAIEEETDAINRIKDKLAKCDDVSGTDEDLVKRLQNTKVIKIMVYVNAIHCCTL